MAFERMTNGTDSALSRVCRRGDDKAGATITKTVFLHPGHIVACGDPVWLKTIVGSCVAVCLWDASTRVGGMNHFLLPHATRVGKPEGRFGRAATLRLIDMMLVAGARRRNLLAKVFGGACVLDAFRASTNHLGLQNVKAAMQVLDQQQIPVEQRCVGGTRGRKVAFFTTDGRVIVEVV